MISLIHQPDFLAYGLRVNPRFVYPGNALQVIHLAHGSVEAESIPWGMLGRSSKILETVVRSSDGEVPAFSTIEGTRRGIAPYDWFADNDGLVHEAENGDCFLAVMWGVEKGEYWSTVVRRDGYDEQKAVCFNFRNHGVWLDG